MFITEIKLLELTGKVVMRYVNKGIIPTREMEDTQMFMIEKFLQKQSQIQNNFLGNSNITTYCISVLNNMCCEVIRKELKHWKNKLDDIPEEKEPLSFSASKETVIQDEIKYLDKIFVLFDKEKLKVNIALCYYYQLDINQNDLLEYCKEIKQRDMTIDLSPEKKLSKGEIFSNLAILIGQVENKEIKADAVRMWLTKTINTIINRLNGPFNRTYYDKESFQVLYELYNAERS